MRYKIGGYVYEVIPFRPKRGMEKLPKGQVWTRAYYDFGKGPVDMGEGPILEETLKAGDIVRDFTAPC